MAFVLADRVKETSTTTGTGDMALAGAEIGYQSFAVIGNNNSTYYTITLQGGTEWEVGIGTYETTGPDLQRDTVLSNSLGTTAKINFSAGIKDVFVTYPSERSVYVEGSSIVPGATATLPVSSGGTGSNTATFSGANITSLNASAISSGTLAVANGGTGSNTATFSGANITSLNASAISSGTLAGARLGTTENVQFGSLGVGTAASGTSGEIRATNNVTAFYTSDRKFKTNIQSISNALTKVCEIGGKTFEWTEDYINDHGGEDGYFLQKNDFGVIAQDVQSVFPIAVRAKPDGTLAVDYEKLCALAFAAIIELKAEVDALKGG